VIELSVRAFLNADRGVTALKGCSVTVSSYKSFSGMSLLSRAQWLYDVVPLSELGLDKEPSKLYNMAKNFASQSTLGDKVMSELPNLQDVQKRTMRLTTFEDGFWDLLLGFIFMSLAIYPVTRELLGPEWNLVLFLSLLALMVIGQLVLKHFISGPRIGYARPRRTPKTRMLLLVTVVFVLLTFGLVLLTLLGPESSSTGGEPTTPSLVRGYLVEWIVVLVMGGIFSTMGYIFGVARLYFYGWMLGLANLASVYMSHTVGWTFQIPGAIAAGIILVIGVTLLLRFLRNYPVRTQEV
jgi:hypothetical protein